MAAKICFNCQSDCNSCDKVVIPVPPVCTGNWDASAWRNYIRKNAVDLEPETIQNSFGIWQSTGKRDSNGELLYRLKK